MPNWCSNRMHFSGEPAQIAEIKRLASGAVTPLYRRATNEGMRTSLNGTIHYRTEWEKYGRMLFKRKN